MQMCCDPLRYPLCHLTPHHSMIQATDLEQKVKDTNNRIAYEVLYFCTSGCCWMGDSLNKSMFMLAPPPSLLLHTHTHTHCKVALLKTQIESQKVESIKYLAGGIFSIVTIVLSVVLGMWRLMKWRPVTTTTNNKHSPPFPMHVLTFTGESDIFIALFLSNSSIIYSLIEEEN